MADVRVPAASTNYCTVVCQCRRPASDSGSLLAKKEQASTDHRPHAHGHPKKQQVSHGLRGKPVAAPAAPSQKADADAAPVKVAAPVPPPVDMEPMDASGGPPLPDDESGLPPLDSLEKDSDEMLRPWC